MPRSAGGSSGSKTLLFITNATLRAKIEDAVEMSSILHLLNQSRPPIPVFHKQENCRAIILYAASIIEAVLLYLYKEKAFSKTRVRYSDVHILPAAYQPQSGTQMVVAKQKNVPRGDRELMLDVLLDFFSDEVPLLKKKLKKKVEKAQNVRNTYHLSKSRQGIRCNDAAVDSATDAVVETISAVQSYLAAHP